MKNRVLAYRNLSLVWSEVACWSLLRCRSVGRVNRIFGVGEWGVIPICYFEGLGWGVAHEEAYAGVTAHLSQGTQSQWVQRTEARALQPWGREELTWVLV